MSNENQIQELEERISRLEERINKAIRDLDRSLHYLENTVCRQMQNDISDLERNQLSDR